ncbi:MAG: hypothetical protein JXA82_19355 [Sedimentisphaerales bacterium]|nr:hypothetical protein [Sedimentisphaerales bacterium]
MEPINRESRTSVRFQISYVLAFPWLADSARSVQFQKSLLDQGLEFGQVNSTEKRLTLTRQQPSHLQIRLDSPGPQVAQIQILSANPGYDIDMFSRDAEAATMAYKQAWSLEQCQLIQTSAMIHHLYSSQDHAFKYLWEVRLGQSPADFKTLGSRPVAGGGLRLLLPPHQLNQDQEPRSIEVRAESFLREPRKLLIETIFIWPRPRSLQAEEGFSPAGYLKQVEEFAANEVWSFFTQSRPLQPPGPDMV